MQPLRSACVPDASNSSVQLNWNWFAIVTRQISSRLPLDLHGSERGEAVVVPVGLSA
jgi:hypothetical protein